MHVPPAIRRWSTRLGLAVIVAAVIGYVPAQVLRRDPRSVMLRDQLDALEVEARSLAAENAALAREIDALRTDIGAVENRARVDLGMVYPDELVLRVPEAAP